jgi:hypothetical protein
MEGYLRQWIAGDDGRIEVQNPSTLRVADIQVSIGQFQRETWCDLVSHTRMQCPGKIGLRSGIGPTAAVGGDVSMPMSPPVQSVEHEMASTASQSK